MGGVFLFLVCERVLLFRYLQGCIIMILDIHISMYVTWFIEPLNR